MTFKPGVRGPQLVTGALDTRVGGGKGRGEGRGKVAKGG
jgi:hypothetical protein